MGRVGRTPPFRAATGGVMAGSIAEVGYRRLGGLPQWVLIRGESIANPALILLHGGPGFSETHFFRHFCSALEKVFTVVYWDQRGSGRSFDPGIDRSSMTVDRFVADLDELVDAVRVRLGKDKVVIFGHSWGSALGVLYSARFPEKVAAYVGSGQIGSWPAGESLSYDFALGAAQRDAETSVAYYTALTAPMKELVWFEQSGHEPFVDEPATFTTVMVESVRPVVV
jgi:pimeloyl-ACP methyl ester carboxylesterase